MSYYNYWDEDEGWYDDYDDWDESFSNSAGDSSVKSGENNMSRISVGEQFETGNDVVNSLPNGAVLRVVDAGLLEVAEIPAPSAADFAPGDRIDTKYGEATVVGISSRLSVQKNGNRPLGEDYVLYVADSDPVVRRVRANTL